MPPSTSTLLLLLYITSETLRANYAYHAFHTYPQISAPLITLLSESLKFLIALFFILKSNNISTFSALKKSLYNLRDGDEIGFKKVGRYALPAALYLVNNLIYYTVLPKTDPSLLQVCVLMKVPTTGVLHHFMVKRQRNVWAWVSLGGLCVGLVIFNIPSSSSSSSSVKDLGGIGGKEGGNGGMPNWILAPIAGFAIACLSAMASIATETSTKVGSFWESQVWLYLWGVLFSIIALPLSPSSLSSSSSPSSSSSTIEFAYTASLLGLVFITSLTGIVVAVVLRARDNILKLIGTACSLVTIAVSQYILLPGLREESFTPWRVAGGGVVGVATWCYNWCSQEALRKGEEGRGGDEALLDGDVENEGLLSQEGEKDGGEIVGGGENGEKVPWSRPTVEKVVFCAVIVGIATVEVALRT